MSSDIQSNLGRSIYGCLGDQQDCSTSTLGLGKVTVFMTSIKQDILDRAAESTDLPMLKTHL